MEETVLRTLHYQITVPSAHAFLVRYVVVHLLIFSWTKCIVTHSFVCIPQHSCQVLESSGELPLVSFMLNVHSFNHSSLTSLILSFFLARRQENRSALMLHPRRNTPIFPPPPLPTQPARRCRCLSRQTVSGEELMEPNPAQICRLL
jgi:hypothetical protein